MSIETLAAESTSGKKNVERKNTRSHGGIREATSTASSIATASWAPTATTTNTAVLRKEIPTVRSVAISAKLARPTNCGEVMMSQRKKASSSEPTMGSTTKMPTPIMVGARNSQRSSTLRESVVVMRL